MDTFKLIQIIKEHPILYDHLDKQYNDKNTKMGIWNQIAVQMDSKAGRCRNTWSNLKSSYIRIMRKRLAGDVLAKKWKYEDVLSFLYPKLEWKIRNASGDSESEYDDFPTSDDSFQSESSSECEDNSNIDEDMLIQAVKTHPCLYDTESKAKGDVFAAWVAVSKTMNCPVRRCQKQWKILKMQYKQILQTSRQRACKRVRWKHFTDMEFIRTYIETKLNKPTKKRPTKNSQKTIMEFFVSMANIVKKLPQAQQEVVETEILNLITETELEYCRNNSRTHVERNVLCRNVGIDDDEFIERVTYNSQCSTAENVRVPNESQALDRITASEQYIVQVIPSNESNANKNQTEEFIISVLPDDVPTNRKEIKLERNANGYETLSTASSIKKEVIEDIL